MRKHRFVNNFSTTLATAMDNLTSTMVVSSATGLPSEGDFFLLCQTEIVRVTHRSGTTMTVIRGEGGTSVSPHALNAPVVSTFCADDMVWALKDLKKYLAYPDYRFIGLSGAELTATDFPITNGGTDVTDGLNGVIILRPKNHTSTSHITGMAYNLSSGDWAIRMHAAAPAINLGQTNPSSLSQDYFGLWFRANTGGQMWGISLKGNGLVTVESKATYLNASTVLASLPDAFGRADCWFRITRSTNNYTFNVSFDGITYFQLYSANLGALGAVSAGLWAHNDYLLNAHYHMLSFHVE